MREKSKNSKITETRNPESLNLDQMEVEEILQLMNREDTRVIDAVAEEIPAIRKAVELIVPRMRAGGRLFYVGAGTSGRLGVLDAVECIPTFSVDEGRVVGLLAGGKEAMFLAQEDIEDNLQQGIEEVKKYGLQPSDSIIGIAASGETPFVIGALREAASRGAAVIGLVCNPDSSIARETEICIKPVVGPEVLTGSTRMKAGTAQKMVLNMISTTVMIKLGKVYSNLMVDLKASNNKLRERGKTIFMNITGASYSAAEKYLEQANYNVKLAIIMYVRGCSLAKAEELLEESQSILRGVIG